MIDVIFIFKVVFYKNSIFYFNFLILIFIKLFLYKYLNILNQLTHQNGYRSIKRRWIIKRGSIYNTYQWWRGWHLLIR